MITLKRKEMITKKTTNHLLKGNKMIKPANNLTKRSKKNPLHKRFKKTATSPKHKRSKLNKQAQKRLWFQRLGGIDFKLISYKKIY